LHLEQRYPDFFALKYPPLDLRERWWGTGTQDCPNNRFFSASDTASSRNIRLKPSAPDSFPGRRRPKAVPDDRLAVDRDVDRQQEGQNTFANQINSNPPLSAIMIFKILI
jgi:hypothetical protein